MEVLCTGAAKVFSAEGLRPRGWACVQANGVANEFYGAELQAIRVDASDFLSATHQNRAALHLASYKAYYA